MQVSILQVSLLLPGSIGDGSQLTVVYQHLVLEIDSVVGSAATINFGSNIVVSTINASIVTVRMLVFYDGGPVGIGSYWIGVYNQYPVGGGTVHITR